MPTALISVSDKTGVAQFARGLNALGWQLLASGGTARVLRDAGLPVTDVAAHTGSPEILGGRVKTLHPAIHGGILARDTQPDRDDLAAQNIGMIDLVAVNLYPFENAVEQPNVQLSDAIENIDIGGVALMRAAAKNFQRVTVVTTPADYNDVLNAIEAGNVDLALRRRLAVRAFTQTTAYDAAIASFLSNGGFTAISLHRQQPLRYGENPHQQGHLYALAAGDGPLGGTQLQGKGLSYTNMLDCDAAWRAAADFDTPTVCIVKHVSPCGLATHPALPAAFAAALASDPVSAFGGVMAANCPIDDATVAAIGNLFLEAIVAPGFTDTALQRLAERKNLRLIEMPDATPAAGVEYRSVLGGMVAQTPDTARADDPSGWEVITTRPPTDAEMQALTFAWQAAAHVKSNAIVLAKGTAAVGIGGGQPNRVDCVRIAGNRAGDNAAGSVMASDAFFPFSDSVEVAAALGVTAIVQPGGSIRDDDSIAAANKHNIAMLATGTRHFRH